MHYLFLEIILVTTAPLTSFTTEISMSGNPPYKNDILLLQNSSVISQQVKKTYKNHKMEFNFKSTLRHILPNKF